MTSCNDGHCLSFARAKVSLPLAVLLIMNGAVQAVRAPSWASGTNGRDILRQASLEPTLTTAMLPSFCC